MAREFHVTGGNELFNVLQYDVPSSGEDCIVYLAAGTYFQSLPDAPHVGWFTTSPRGYSLTIAGEPGTRARDVVIDPGGHGHCLRIYDSTIKNTVPWETALNPEFARPELVVSGITLQNGEYEYTSGGLDIQASFYAVTVKNCIIRNNSSGCGHGGGLSIASSFNLTIENTQILNNTVRERAVTWVDCGGRETPGTQSWGGGLNISAPWNGAVLRNNIVAGNVAQGGVGRSEGGGIRLPRVFNAIVHLINNTIYGNIADEGGGVHFGGPPCPSATVNIYNNIIYGNTALAGEESSDLCFRDDPDPGGTSSGQVNVFNTDYGHALGTINASGGNLNTDPLFVDPGAGDFHLAAGSPMINAGSNDVPVPPGLPESDFEGQGRVRDGAPDIGADEYFPGLKARRMAAGLRIRLKGDGPAVLKPMSQARLAISVAANDDKGRSSTMYVTMDSAMGKLFLSREGWVKEKASYYRGPLKDILPLDLPAPPPLKSGACEFEFVLEMEDRHPPGGNERLRRKVRLSDGVACHVWPMR